MENVNSTSQTATANPIQPERSAPRPAAQTQERPVRADEAVISDTAKAALAAEQTQTVNTQRSTQVQQALTQQAAADPSARLYA